MRIATPGFRLSVALFVLCFGFACSKNQVSQESHADAVAPLDRVSATLLPPENHFLHKTFTLKTYEKFDFTVPAHSNRPTLHGSFVSFSQGNGGITSNANANVELMLLNGQEFDDFIHKRSGSTTYAGEPSFNQEVGFAVPSTHEQPQNYSLVFINTQGGPKSKVVKADFTVSFE
jgi:hypothetical protein